MFFCKLFWQSFLEKASTSKKSIFWEAETPKIDDVTMFLKVFWFFRKSQFGSKIDRFGVHFGSLSAPFWGPSALKSRLRIEKKVFRKNLKNLHCKRCSKTSKMTSKMGWVFWLFGVFLASSPPFRSRSARDHSQIDFGPILVRFWSEFWTDFGGFLDRFGIDFGSICETTSSLHRDVTHV